MKNSARDQLLLIRREQKVALHHHPKTTNEAGEDDIYAPSLLEADEVESLTITEQGFMKGYLES